MEKSQTQVIDRQNGGKVYVMHKRTADKLCASYPSRFSYFEELENTEMPKIPQPATKLEDGSYLFKVTSCVTTKGQYGSQEELNLVVLNEQAEETTKHMKMWIGHENVKQYEIARKGGILIVDTESNEWAVKVPCMFNGVLQNGKIILITRP